MRISNISGSALSIRLFVKHKQTINIISCHVKNQSDPNNIPGFSEEQQHHVKKEGIFGMEQMKIDTASVWVKNRV